MADDLEEEWWLEDKQLDDNAEGLETTNGIKLKKKKDVKKKKKQDDIKSKKTQKIKSKSLTKNENSSINSTKPKLKRKAEDIDFEDDEDKSEKKPVKKKKNIRKRKKISEELLTNKPVPGKAEDFISIIKKTYEGKLSTVEWDELEINDKHFLECNEVIDVSAVQYFEKILPTWRKLIKASDMVTGSPLLLVITSSGARAVELNREIKKFKGKKCQCAKLFAKHFKIQDQQKFLKTKICHIGVGTPQRIQKLIELGCLKLNNLVAIVIDWNWRDIKFKRLVDIPEIKKYLLELFKDSLSAHVQSSACKIGLL
ncbi:protein CMSS1-like [Gigantopelta aegis]|uniref:protein CMSS1-like n=1 Tax=Gigantopelta aegis TaxID=1735272 RepID=UPI001B88E49D|nr:protein CMSS1-like [Gigantopelta aegis]